MIEILSIDEISGRTLLKAKIKNNAIILLYNEPYSEFLLKKAPFATFEETDKGNEIAYFICERMQHDHVACIPKRNMLD
jgi:hypothetical protein